MKIGLKALIVLILFFTGTMLAQKNISLVKLDKASVSGHWEGHDIGMEFVEDDGDTILKLTGHGQPGLIWMKDCQFTNGTIELDIKGSSEQSNSFVGVAFNFVDQDNYEAVYFRPFNFMSGDSVRRKHSVQYISKPEYTWKYLREQHPGKYENSVNPVPDPDQFFHVKIVIEQPQVRVFVDGSSEASLVLKQLSNMEGGSIGLWVDGHSVAYFKDLMIIREGE